MDNLFLNVNVAHVLLALDIGIMGTTRKNAIGIPESLKNIKSLNKALVYGGIVATVDREVLCVAWQDNNVVLMITTAFSVHRDSDYVVRPRKRPGKGSTNAAITRPVYGDAPIKNLSIPCAINAYNNSKNFVDVANQLREVYTCHRLYKERT